MKTWALTGGIGMGKSTTATLLRDLGFPLIDTDEVARQVVAPGQPALQEITREFGRELLDNDGALRREALAQVVFADRPARQQLENIVHPRIREVWEAILAQWKAEQRPQAVVVIPLLFEIRAEGQFDRSVCVACSESTQSARLRERGWDPEQIRLRLGAQLPGREKMARADYVLWNESPRSVLADQVRRVFGGTL